MTPTPQIVTTRMSPGSFLVASPQISCSVMSNSLQPHGVQHARLPCPSPTPGACSNSCPLSQSCHPTISSSVIPFSSRLQSPGQKQWANNFDLLQFSHKKRGFDHIYCEFIMGGIKNAQFSSVTQLHPTLCDLKDCSTSDFPVHHQLLELAQTHVH